MKQLDFKNESNYKKESAYIRAQKRLKEVKGFYMHALWYVIINIFIIVMIGVNTGGNIWNFGVFSTAIFWGIGLLFHAIMVFGKNLFFSKSWENRKIKEFMEKENNKNRFE